MLCIWVEASYLSSRPWRSAKGPGVNDLICLISSGTPVKAGEIRQHTQIGYSICSTLKYILYVIYLFYFSIQIDPGGQPRGLEFNDPMYLVYVIFQIKLETVKNSNLLDPLNIYNLVNLLT